ncbi:MAG: polymer-forming cytoskeletal protein [Oligoflexia bacterium]|nr:polymer-forming cytoskeletal protein [Oligoflexia bacterium]MBF0367584.1 polymer-forming cytoskeletal protein [Oligoflexia bacterium]
MFRSKEKITAVIEEGCKFEGNFSFKGIVRIAGALSGRIFSNDTLIISEGAVINADINAGIVFISGTVKGNVRATSRVEIRRPASFEGTIITPSLIVEEGVIFHGTTKMREVSS